jgi:hypothetical protein
MHGPTRASNVAARPRVIATVRDHQELANSNSLETFDAVA